MQMPHFLIKTKTTRNYSCTVHCSTVHISCNVQLYHQLNSTTVHNSRTVHYHTPASRYRTQMLTGQFFWNVQARMTLLKWSVMTCLFEGKCITDKYERMWVSIFNNSISCLFECHTFIEGKTKTTNIEYKILR